MAPADPVTIDDETLAHLERLARLEVPEDERESVKADLAAVLAFVAQLEQVPGRDGAPPAVAVAGARPDQPRPSLGQAEALSVAPSRKDGYFQVPRTVDEG